ncbi:hypothetical protein [Streptomyces crystallinus]
MPTAHPAGFPAYAVLAQHDGHDDHHGHDGDDSHGPLDSELI